MSKFSKWLDFNHKHTVPVHHLHEHLSPFYNFQKEFDNLFQNFYHSLPIPVTEFHNLDISPSIDIIEDETSFKVEVEMPGVDEKDIEVSINDDNILNIKAHKEISSKDEGKNYIIREVGYGSYERSIPLPNNVDTDKAESTFKKGMLWVTLPKKAIDKSKVHQLEVKKSE